MMLAGQLGIVPFQGHPPASAAETLGLLLIQRLQGASEPCQEAQSSTCAYPEF